MSKKWFYFLSVILLVTVLIAGCAKSTPTPTTKPTSSPTPSPTAKPTTSPTPTGPVVNWKMNSYYAADHVLTKYINMAIENTKQRSNGRLNIELYPADSLFKSTSSPKYLRDGVAQIAYLLGFYSPGEIPEIAMSEDWAIIGFNMAAFKKWIYAPGGYDAIVRPLHLKYDMVPLFWWPQVGSTGWSTKVPVSSLDYFKGKMTRRIGFGFSDAISEKLGMGTVQMSMYEAFDALQKGTLDVFSTTLESYESVKFNEVTPHRLGPSIIQWVTAWVVTSSAYNSLPKDLQDVLVSSFRDAEAAYFDGYAQMLVDINAKLKTKGVSFTNLPESEVQKIQTMLGPIWEDKIKQFPFMKQVKDGAEAAMR